jgi:hypothetical protein
MIYLPHQGYSILKGEPINLMVFHQYQIKLRNVKVLTKDDSLFIHYPSDHILKIDNVPKEVLLQINQDRKIEMWEIDPLTGRVVENYIATY